MNTLLLSFHTSYLCIETFQYDMPHWCRTRLRRQRTVIAALNGLTSQQQTARKPHKLHRRIRILLQIIAPIFHQCCIYCASPHAVWYRDNGIVFGVPQSLIEIARTDTHLYVIICVKLALCIGLGEQTKLLLAIAALVARRRRLRILGHCQPCRWPWPLRIVLTDPTFTH